MRKLSRGFYSRKYTNKDISAYRHYRSNLNRVENCKSFLKVTRNEILDLLDGFLDGEKEIRCDCYILDNKFILLLSGRTYEIVEENWVCAELFHIKEVNEILHRVDFEFVFEECSSETRKDLAFLFDIFN